MEFALFPFVGGLGQGGSVTFFLTTDNAMHGGLRVDGAHAAALRAAGELTFPARTRCWFDRLHDSIPDVPLENVKELRAQGIDGYAIFRNLATELLSTCSPIEAICKARHQLQRAVTKAIQRRQQFRPHFRIRAKLKRRQLGDDPRVQTDRFEKHLCLLNRHAPPRVTAAVLSTG